MSEGFHQSFVPAPSNPVNTRISVWISEGELWVLLQERDLSDISGSVSEYEEGMILSSGGVPFSDGDEESLSRGEARGGESSLSWESPLWAERRWLGELALHFVSSKAHQAGFVWTCLVSGESVTRGAYLTPLLFRVAQNWRKVSRLGVPHENPFSLHLPAPESYWASPGVEVFPVRTPTLPPATHTNTVILGEGTLTLVDPASPYPEETDRLVRRLEARLANGEKVTRILLTHHHMDHVGGVTELAARYEVPIAAHPRTRQLLEGRVAVDEDVEHEDWLPFSRGKFFQALHTPGHASGHLVFWEPVDGWLIAGDMVAGKGTIVIDPPEGNMSEYVEQLAFLRSLKSALVVPSHGPIVSESDAFFTFYLEHRAAREQEILDFLIAEGPCGMDRIVPVVYQGLNPRAIPLALRQILAHLQKCERDGVILQHSPNQWSAKVPH